MVPPPSERGEVAPNRSSCKMRPGSSSVRGSTSVPWNRARVSTTPSARSGSSSSAIQPVRSESRPYTVMDHGTPAATTARSGRSGSKMRSAPKSSPPRATVRANPSWSVSTTGRPRRHLCQRSAGVERSTGSPQR